MTGVQTCALPISDLNKPEDGRKSKKRGSSSEGFTRFFLNLGKTDNLKPTTVIGMIKDFSGIKDIDIGAIDIMQNFSFFETDSDYTDKILKGFKNKELKNRKIVLEIATARANGNKSERSERSERKPFTKKRRGKRSDFDKPRKRRRR